MEKVSVAPIPKSASQTVNTGSSQKVDEQEYAAVIGSVHGYNAAFSNGRGFDLTGVPVMLSGRGELADTWKAHELAHAGGYEALERDSGRTAAGVMRRVWTRVKGMARGVLPALRSGLRLQRCGASPNREVRTAPPAPAAPDPCPTSVELESVQDMTPGGLALGYRTGYGIVSVMHLLPDTADWSGAQVFERVSQSSSTCPGAWQMCSPAMQPFPINQSRHSTVLGELPARRNRFYDFHTSRWNESRLHDSTQNPTGMDECTVVCNQSYVCGERVLGNFRITRHFSKDVRNGREITVVNTTKTAVR